MKRKLRERFRCPNNDLFILALIFLIVFLLIELALRIYNLYYYEPFVDVPSHFFAGLAIGIGTLWILSLTDIKRKKISTLFYTFVIAVIWEILETLQEIVIENPPYLRDIFFWDGFWDIIVTVMGGAFVFVLIPILKIKDV